MIGSSWNSVLSIVGKSMFMVKVCISVSDSGVNWLGKFVDGFSVSRRLVVELIYGIGSR